LVQTGDGGYALAGYTNSYGTGADDFWLVKTDFAGDAKWNKTYGGTGSDFALSMVQTGDGGYALAGYTNSYGTGWDDLWLVRTDLAGTLQWNKTYGGAGGDFAFSVVQTGDGGYALAGYTESYGAGSFDFWLVKTCVEMNLEHQRYLGGSNLIYGWSRTYGGAGYDVTWSVVQTGDGGYALAGWTDSYGVGGRDFWLVKTDAVGNMQWNNTYGLHANDEYACSVVQTGDGGYALVGYTFSYGAGYSDFWLVKTDASGTAQWVKTYGGTGYDYGLSVVQTMDGGYALAGRTNSYGAGDYDFWLVKTDSAGTALWNKTYGGTSHDGTWSMIQTVDGGYALAGQTFSFGAGDSDFWLVKTDSAGTMQWDKTYGGAGWEGGAQSMIQTVDGGYALAGETTSYGDVHGDFWLVKTDSAGNCQWNKTYAGANEDDAHSVVQASDGGYAIAGDAYSYVTTSADIWLVKTDSAGNLQWSKTCGGTDGDSAYSLVQAFDGGYTLAGYTYSSGAGQSDAWLVKTDVEMGLARTGLTNNTITLYRGETDLYWNYVRVRIWLIKEPTWIYGDINMDGIVDNKDLYIIGRNYGKTFSLLSLGGIVAVAGVRAVKKRKQSEKPSYIS
jgi:hypothetical protein